MKVYVYDVVYNVYEERELDEDTALFIPSDRSDIYQVWKGEGLSTDYCLRTLLKALREVLSPAPAYLSTECVIRDNTGHCRLNGLDAWYTVAADKFKQAYKNRTSGRLSAVEEMKAVALVSGTRRSIASTSPALFLRMYVTQIDASLRLLK